MIYHSKLDFKHFKFHAVTVLKVFNNYLNSTNPGSGLVIEIQSVISEDKLVLTIVFKKVKYR